MSETDKTKDEIIEELLVQINSALAQNAKLTAKIDKLTQQVAWLSKQLFGRRSEQIDPNQMSLLEDESVFTEPEQTGKQSETVNDNQPPRKPKARRKELIARDLPVKETLVQREGTQCVDGHTLTPVGKRFVREVAQHIPGRLYVEKIFEQTYKCKACEEVDGDSHLYHGNAPRALITHSLATSALVAEILDRKFIQGTPLYRQQQIWQRAGLILSESTMANWVIKTSKNRNAAL